MGEIYHYGIKGMRWGIRRTPEQLGHRRIKGGLSVFRNQNKSGLGKTSVVLSEEEKKKRENEKKAVRERGKDLGNVTKNAKTFVDTTKELYNKNRKELENKEVSERLKSLDISSMSDKELRDVVNRMNMEQQYKDLMTRQYSNEVRKGSSIISDILDYSGSVLATAGSIIAIITSIQALRK